MILFQEGTAEPAGDIAMIDMSIPRIALELKNNMTRSYAAPVLPEGYRFATYADGDAVRWAEVMCSVGFFEDVEKATAYFEKEFLCRPQEAKKHVFFVVAPDGKYVGSCSCWNDAGFDKLHWLAVLPTCQGLHLGNALVQKVLYTFQQEKIAPVYLDTQTTSHRAICLYVKEGFSPLRLSRKTGEPVENYAQAVAILQEKMPEKYFALYKTAECDC